MHMPCIEELNYEILMGNSSYEECADYIISNFKEIYYVCLPNLSRPLCDSWNILAVTGGCSNVLSPAL